MKKVQQIKSIVSVVLVILFMSYYAGITCFPHTHTYEWGTVTHSHPYSSTHSHTGTALQFIAHLSALLLYITWWSFVLFIAFQVKHRVPALVYLFVGKRIILTPPRSPPFIG